MLAELRSAGKNGIGVLPENARLFLMAETDDFAS